MEEKEEATSSTGDDQKQGSSQEADPVVDKLLAEELDGDAEAPEAKLFAMAEGESNTVRVTGTPLQKATGDAKEASADAGEADTTETKDD